VSAYPPSLIVANVPDCELVVRAQAGDEFAFEELIARHACKLSRLTTRFFAADMDRQEVLQAALLSAWQNLPTFEGRAQFGTWLYRITTNAALMHLRGHKRRPEVAVDNIEPLATGQVGHSHTPVLWGSTGWSQRPDDKIQSQELCHRLQSAVDALPERLRSVFLMRHIDGLSTEATAQSLGLSLGAARARLHRAKVSLRQMMIDYAMD